MSFFQPTLSRVVDCDRRLLKVRLIKGFKSYLRGSAQPSLLHWLSKGSSNLSKSWNTASMSISGFARIVQGF